MIELGKRYWSFLQNKKILFATRNCSEYFLFVVDKQGEKKKKSIFFDSVLDTGWVFWKKKKHSELLLKTKAVLDFPIGFTISYQILKVTLVLSWRE